MQYHFLMKTDKDSLIENLIKELERNDKNIRFSRLLTICEDVFGEYRTSGSHHTFQNALARRPTNQFTKVKRQSL
jgi:hypothetical protein